MANNTPPAPKKHGIVIPMPKKPRTDDTQSFVTEGSPKSRTEIVVGGPMVRDDDTERTTLVDPPTDQHDPVPVRRGPPPLPKSREPDLRLQIKRFAKGELVADFYDNVEEALLVKHGRLVLEVLNQNGKKPEPLKDFRIEIGSGKLLFEELLESQGDGGIVSDFRITAKEATEVHVLSLDDLVDAPDQVTFRARLYAVLNAASTATGRSRRQKILHWEEENAWVKALDEAKQRAYELEIENGRLMRQVSTLDELNRRLVTSAVQKAVRERLMQLEREVRELREQNRKQAKTIHELEATSRSQMAFVEHVGEEVQEYERLRDLLALETDDPERLTEELKRIFLQLYQCRSSRLQTLGVLGLGELGTLGISAEVLPDLSDEEVDQGISELPPSIAPPDPTKNPPHGG